MNKVVLIGRLTQDPNFFTTKSNIPYVKFTLAVKRNYGNDLVDFIPIVAWNKTATFAFDNISKGLLVAVEGSLVTGRYQNEQGQTIYTYDVNVNSIDILESKSVAIQRRENSEHRANNQTMTFAPEENKNFQTKPSNSISSYDVPPTTKVEQNNDEESEWSIDDLMK